MKNKIAIILSLVLLTQPAWAQKPLQLSIDPDFIDLSKIRKIICNGICPHEALKIMDEAAVLDFNKITNDKMYLIVRIEDQSLADKIRNKPKLLFDAYGRTGELIVTANACAELFPPEQSVPGARQLNNSLGCPNNGPSTLKSTDPSVLVFAIGAMTGGSCGGGGQGGGGSSGGGGENMTSLSGIGGNCSTAAPGVGGGSLSAATGLNVAGNSALKDNACSQDDVHVANLGSTEQVAEDIPIEPLVPASAPAAVEPNIPPLVTREKVPGGGTRMTTIFSSGAKIVALLDRNGDPVFATRYDKDGNPGPVKKFKDDNPMNDTKGANSAVAQKISGVQEKLTGYGINTVTNIAQVASFFTGGTRINPNPDAPGSLPGGAAGQILAGFLQRYNPKTSSGGGNSPWINPGENGGGNGNVMMDPCSGTLGGSVFTSTSAGNFGTNGVCNRSAAGAGSEGCMGGGNFSFRAINGYVPSTLKPVGKTVVGPSGPPKSTGPANAPAKINKVNVPAANLPKSGTNWNAPRK